MRSIRSVALALLAALAFVSCSRDPNVVKKRYLDSGDKYFEKARYKEAAIQYRNAIKIDPRYGLAHYKMALVSLKGASPNWGGAVNELRRAKELLPASQQEHWDSVVKLAEIYLSPVASHDESIMADIQGSCDELLARDPNSFDGHRLLGDLNYVKSAAAYHVKNDAEGRKDLDAALAEYRKADAIKSGDPGVTLQIARVLWREQDFAGAEQGFRSVLAKNKGDVESYRELYALLWDENKHKEAEAVLQDGYRNNPKQFSFLIWLAEQYVIENRRDDMLGVLQQIEAKAGEYPGAYFDVGDFYLRSGDGDSAVKEYKEGIAKDGKNKATYQKRIVEVLMKQGKREEAAAYVDQILKDNPKDPDARGVQASVALDKGDVAKALPELQQVVASAPNNPVAHYNLGRAFYMHGDAELARQQFSKAIELRPEYITARLSLAQLEVRHRPPEYDAAVKSAQDILRYDPNNTPARLIAAVAMMGQEKFTESRAILDQIVKVNPSSAEATFELGVLDLAEKQYKDAEAAFRRSYELNPASPQGMRGVVETYMQQNMVEKAIQTLQAESARTPSRLDFHLALGDVNLQVGRYDDAIAEFQKVLVASPKGSTSQGEMYLQIGEAYRRKGDFAAAINAFQEARKTLPDNVSGLTALGITLAAADRWPEARQIYEGVLKLDPTNGVVLNNLAFGLAEHNGDLDQALTMAQQAERKLSDWPEVSDTLAWIYLKKNLPDQALPILQGLVTKKPDSAIFRYHLGMAKAQKGDKAQAKLEAQKALALNPANGEKKQIQDFLSRL